jgi:hypothetical protein
MKRILITAAAAAAALAGSAAVAAPAMASNGPGPSTATVVASTNEINVPDTTSGTATSQSSPGGPVWAWDNVTKTFRVTPNGNGQYTVSEIVNGTFSAFDEPNTGDTVNATPINVDGQMHGTNTYTVYSPNALPNPHGLPAQVNYSATPVSTSALIADIFNNDASVQVGGGGNWVFSYHAAHGSMTQSYLTQPADWGNITG